MRVKMKKAWKRLDKLLKSGRLANVAKAAGL